METIKLNRNQLAVANAASTNGEMRPVLANARLANGEIVAADGYILARHPVEGVNGHTLLLGAKELKGLKGDASLEIGEGIPTATTHNKKGVTTSTDIACTIGENTFPDVELLYTGLGEAKCTVAFPTSVLRTLLQSAGDAEAITFSIYQSGCTPVGFEATNGTHGLVMPYGRTGAKV